MSNKERRLMDTYGMSQVIKKPIANPESITSDGILQHAIKSAFTEGLSFNERLHLSKRYLMNEPQNSHATSAKY